MPAYLFEVPEKKKCRVIIDSDTACEADDPFVIAYALLSPKLIVRGIVAEHFAQPGSMEKSRAAARKLVSESMMTRHFFFSGTSNRYAGIV